MLPATDNRHRLATALSSIRTPAAARASRDHQDLLAHKVTTETLEKTEDTEMMGDTERMAKFCSVHCRPRNHALSAHQDHQEISAHPAQRDHPDQRANPPTKQTMAKREIKVCQDLKAFPDPLDLQDPLDQRDNPVSLSRSTDLPDLLEKRDHKDLLDQKDNPDGMLKMDHKAKLAQSETKAKQALKEALAHPEVPDHKESQVQKAHAIRAHHHAHRQAIKLLAGWYHTYPHSSSLFHPSLFSSLLHFLPLLLINPIIAQKQPSQNTNS